MATVVSFYNYTGKHNEVPKKFSDRPLSAMKVANLITGVINTLNMTIEVNEEVNNANYVFFEYNNKTYYWFIESVTKDRNLVHYHLVLDVLQTYWSSISNQNLFIERCGIPNLNPSGTFADSLWKVPYERITEKNALHIIQTPNWNTKCIALSVYTSNAVVGDAEMNPQNNGSIMTYILTPTQWATIGDYIWESDFATQISNYLVDVTGFFIKVVLYPFELKPSSGNFPTAEYIKVGPLQLNSLAGSYAYATDNSFKINCGEYNLPINFNDFRDYDPYTKIDVFLPYCGFRNIDRQKFGSTIKIEYEVEYSSGTCAINLYKKYLGAYTLVETIPVEMGVNLPITTSGFGDIMFSLSRMALNTFGSILGSIPMMPNITTSKEDVNYARTIKEGRKNIAKFSDEYNSNKTTHSYYNKNPIGNIIHSATSGLTQHNNGSFGQIKGSALWDYREVFFVVSYPTPDLDKDQNSIYGKLYMGVNTLANIKSSLGTYNLTKAFVKISDNSIDLNGVSMEVYDELYENLTTGIYII